MLRALLAVLLDETVRLADLIASLREASLARAPVRCATCGATVFRIFGFLPPLHARNSRAPP